MNENIREIVNVYIKDNDYEKALSLLKNLPLDEELDKELFQQCTTEFTVSCTSAITDAVKANNKEKAERILASYLKLVGEDTNSMLFRTLVDNIKREEEHNAKKTTNVKLSVGFSSFFENCSPPKSFTESRYLLFTYISLALVSVISGFVCKTSLTTYCIASVVVAISLAIPVINSVNNSFKPVGLILLIIPVIGVLVNSNDLPDRSGCSTLNWLLSFLFIIVYNTIIPSKSWAFRSMVSLILFTLLNPLWYGMDFTPGVEEVDEGAWPYLRFSSKANLWIVFSTLTTLVIYFYSLIGFSKLWSKIKHIRDLILSELWSGIRLYKKKIAIILGSMIAVGVICSVISEIKDRHDYEVAMQEAREAARQDSIKAVEKARLAAIKQARKDSIAAVKRREKARRDSIDYVQHADFVSKYANVGLIISELQMTRGKDDNGIGTKGIKLTVFNPTHKTIKYVIVNLHAVNIFNDRVSIDERCRGIGPVESHGFGAWNFDDVFTDKNDIIDDLVVYLQVVYTNGSSKTIRWKDAYVGNFKASWFYGR